MIKRTQSLKMCLPCPKTRKKTHVYASSAQADPYIGKLQMYTEL